MLTAPLQLLETGRIKMTTGLVPVSGYEPWHVRAIESVKHALTEGVPVLIRLHSAASYPCARAEDGYKLDMESHAVLIVGYDDESETFDIVDPWRSEWGGSQGGVRKLPYEIFSLVIVNASLGKFTLMAPPYKKVSHFETDTGNKSLVMELGFQAPKGYIMDQRQTYFSEFDVEVLYDLHGEQISYRNVLKGKWYIGEYAKTTIPLSRELAGPVHFQFRVNAVLSGARPYTYTDRLTFSFEERFEFGTSGAGAKSQASAIV